MRKLLMAVGNIDTNAATYDFAGYLARITDSSIKGIFLEPLKHIQEYDTVERNDELQLQSITVTDLPENKIIRRHSEEQIKHFNHAFERRATRHIAHAERMAPWDALLQETRFADALILDPYFTLHEHKDETVPSHDMMRLLHEAECPVIIAPLTFQGMDEIIFTYDGGKASVFAMRQFIYLFPALKDIPVTVLEIEPDEAMTDHKEQHNIKEWLHMHFSKVEIKVLEGEANVRLLEYLLGRPGTFTVLGGFGRSKWSRLIQPSISRPLTELIPSPLFIAHT